MKKTLQLAIFFILVGGLYYRYQAPIQQSVAPYVAQVIARLGFLPHPCREAMTYTLGTFDTKFGISKVDFISAMSEAEAIWEKPSGRDLFKYVPNATGVGDLKVNLVYDYREDATRELAKLGITVQDNRASYDSLKAKFNQMKADLEVAKGDYNNSVDSYNKEKSVYENEVSYWNFRGGAPRSEYDKLQTEKSKLDAESEVLAAKEQKINAMVSEINSLVVVLNSLAAKLNISVDQYNTIGASRGESFEEGVYTSDGLNQRIDIYEFSNHDKLVRVLAHEFGHALGLDHVSDPKAIMYKLNQGTSMTLTKADIEALKQKCQIP